MRSSIRASGWHDPHQSQILFGQRDAVRINRTPIGVVGTATGIKIQIPAGDIGIEDLAGILILQLHHTASGASITKGFPFAGIQSAQRAFHARENSSVYIFFEVLIAEKSITTAAAEL